jgi:glycerol uptake facilitator-like aquaporin
VLPAPRRPQAFAAELLGTLVLVLFVGLIYTANSEGTLGYADFAVIGLVHLLILAVLVHTLAGAHLNPAVTVTLAALRRIRPRDAAGYVAMQLLGAIAGAFLVKLLLLDEGEAVGYGSLSVSQQFLDGEALAGFLAELIGTFVLVWAYMGARENGALIVGGAYGAAVMAIGPLTGGGFNPARALGPALAGGEFGDAGTWIVAFVLGPLVGALLAGTLFVALTQSPAGQTEP